MQTVVIVNLGGLAWHLEEGAHAALAPGAELREYLNDLTGGLRADIAFDCAGVPTTYTTGFPEARASVSVTSWNGHGSGLSVQ